MAGGFSQTLDKAPNLTTNYNKAICALNKHQLCRRFGEWGGGTLAAPHFQILTLAGYKWSV